jgi:hypothetical protein
MLKNLSIEFIRTDFYKKSRYKPLAWPTLAIVLVFGWYWQRAKGVSKDGL